MIDVIKVFQQIFIIRVIILLFLAHINLVILHFLEVQQCKQQHIYLVTPNNTCFVYVFLQDFVHQYCQFICGNKPEIVVYCFSWRVVFQSGIVKSLSNYANYVFTVFFVLLGVVFAGKINSQPKIIVGRIFCSLRCPQVGFLDSLRLGFV